MARKNFRVTGGINIDTSAIPTSIIQETITSNSATTVDTIALDSFLAAEYTVTLTQGSKIRTSKVIMQTDGSSVDMTEFAITETGGTMSGVVVSATTASTNAVLQITVTDAASTLVRYKLVRNITTLVGYAPDAPTIGTATATGISSASLTFTAPADNGGSEITSYTAISNPGNISASSPSSPITIFGLSSGTNYTFTVTATNSQGTSSVSSESNQITTDSAPVLSGGILSSDATYYYRSFPSTDSLSVTGGTVTVDSLIIAGGGARRADGGGGGAGGLLFQDSITLTSNNYTITVGAGGAASTSTPLTATNGTNSEFNSLVAIGGGAGLRNTPGGNGGSGGGTSQSTGGIGTPGQGNNGGNNSYINRYSYSGGGGAGQPGQSLSDNSCSAGAGGDGLSTYSSWGSATGYGQNINGTYWFAGGGGGCSPTPTGCSGALSGLGGKGGGGGHNQSVGINTGGGGGGPSFHASNGGSGIVIVRYTRAQVGG